MFAINKNNAIVGAVGLLPLVLTTNPKVLGSIVLYYSIVLIYMAIFVFVKEKDQPKTDSGEYIHVSRTRSHLAWAVDWLVFGGVVFVYTELLNLLPVTGSKNHFIPLNYIVMMQNVLGRSIGFRIFNLYPDNRDLNGKIKIFAINFFLMSAWYLAMFKSVWKIPSDSLVKVIASPLVMLFFINYAVRLNVLKNQSLCEKFFGIQTLCFVPRKS